MNVSWNSLHTYGTTVLTWLYSILPPIINRKILRIFGTLLGVGVLWWKPNTEETAVLVFSRVCSLDSGSG
jgi:hypothetical protein